MRKIFLCLIMCICCLTSTAQEKSIWANHSIGIGWSYMNRDNYKDNNVELTALIYGVYFDSAIGTSLKDYGCHNGKRSYSFNIGYEFPIYINYNDNTKILLGPIVGYTAVGWDDHNYNGTYYYEDYYGYGYYDSYSSSFRTTDEYFNYGVALQIGIDHFGINAKISRNNIGVGIGYIF